MIPNTTTAVLQCHLLGLLMLTLESIQAHVLQNGQSLALKVLAISEPLCTIVDDRSAEICLSRVVTH